MQLLKSFEEKTDKAGDVGEEYMKHTAEYIRLQLLLQSSKLIAWICKILLMGSFFTLSIIFTGIALSVFLTDITGSKLLGYLLSGSIFIVLGVGCYFFKTSIENLIVRKLSKIL